MAYLRRCGEPLSPLQTVKDQTPALFLGMVTAAGSQSAPELAQGPQAQFRPGTHDDVVMQSQAEIPAPLLDLLGHAEIGLRRCRVARRVVMDQDQGAGVQHQRPLDHLARIDRHMVNRAGREKLIGDNAVLTVEVEHVEALDRSADGERAIVQQRLPAADDRVLA